MKIVIHLKSIGRCIKQVTYDGGKVQFVSLRMKIFTLQSAWKII